MSEIKDSIKARYPYYDNKGMTIKLDMGCRNSLPPSKQAHEIFYRKARADGVRAWGIRPGEFTYKKTKEVLSVDVGENDLGAVRGGRSEKPVDSQHKHQDKKRPNPATDKE